MSFFICRDVVVGEPRAHERQAIREGLKGSAYTITAEANTVEELLHYCEQHPPDLVIMDATLPGVTDALMAIKQLKRRHIGLIVLATGSISQNGVVMESLTMGAADFMLKPLQARAVRSCVERNAG